MKILKSVSIIVFITLFVIGCGSSGGGDTPSNDQNQNNNGSNNDTSDNENPTIQTTIVSGTVLDGNGIPIEGAEVTIMSDPVTVTTDANGFFSATVEIGTHTIEIKKGAVLIHSGRIDCKENTPLNIPAIKVGSKSANGTYTYNSQIGELTVNIEITNYTAECGPDQTGPMITTIRSLTPTSLTMDNTDGDGQSTWTRDGGESGDIIGTWKASDDDNSMELIFKSNGTWSLTGEGCGSSDGNGGTGNGITIKKVSIFTETITNHPVGRPDGWYLHLKAVMEDNVDIQSVSVINLDTSIDPNTYTLDYSNSGEDGFYKNPIYTNQQGTYRFTVINKQGQTAEKDAAPVDNPIKLDTIQNMTVSDNSTTPTVSFDTVANADKYRLTIFNSSRTERIYQSDKTNTPSFNVPSGIMLSIEKYYLRAEAHDINTNDGDGRDDTENRTINYMEFVPDSGTTTLFNIADYTPLVEGNSCTYENIDDLSDTFNKMVFECSMVEGNRRCNVGSATDRYAVLSNDGTSVTYYYAMNGGVKKEIEPDYTLGDFQDGYSADFNGMSSYFMLRFWDNLDPATRSVYGIDESYDNIIVWATYDEEKSPNSQNAIIESNLPAGVTLPIGAITDIEFYAPGIGLIAERGISASTGLSDGYRYDLVDCSIIPGGSSIVGTWYFSSFESDNAELITFEPGGIFWYAVYRPNYPEDPGIGFQHGTYSWDAASGELTIMTLDSNTAGDWGVYEHYNHVVTSTLTPQGPDEVVMHSMPKDDTFIAYRLKASTSNPIIGTWLVSPHGQTSGESVGNFMITPDGYYMLINLDGSDDVVGQPGIEYGQYTFNPSSGVFAVTPIADTSEHWGISPDSSQFTLTISGATMTITSDLTTLHRLEP